MQLTAHDEPEDAALSACEAQFDVATKRDAHGGVHAAVLSGMPKQGYTPWLQALFIAVYIPPPDMTELLAEAAVADNQC